MADRDKMTVAEILAAARKADSQHNIPAVKADADSESAPADAAAPAPEESAAESKQEQPAAPAKNVPASGGGRPSVAEMMALARAEKQGGGAAPPAKKAKPQPKPAATKAAPKKEAPAKSAPRDTQSILAAARHSAKAGPMTKAEAAAKPPGTPDATKAKAKEAIVVPPMPVKPGYAKPAAKKGEDEKEPGRRKVLFLFGLSALAVGFTAMTGTLGLWTLATVRFMFPNILREPPSRFRVGFPDQFPAGQVQTKFKAQFGVWIVNTEYQGEQQIFALRSVCTHLGCTPNWLEAEQKFKCPCHGSGFYKDGINFEGPAPRPLERFAISIANDGQVEVDKSRIFKEEKGEWADPACFIPA